MSARSNPFLGAVGTGLLLAGAPAVAPAQDASADDPGLAVDEITVSAPRLETPLETFAGSISVIGREEAQRARQGLSLDEQLKGVPGVFTQNRYNFAQDLRISIRGFGARAPFGIRGVQMIQDGIPLTLPDGSSQVDTIALDSISRVEVIRGPSSSLYGNASGGVVSLTTMEGPPTPFAEVEASFGSFGFNKETLRFGGESGRLNYAGAVSRVEQKGFRDHSSSESLRYNTKLRFDLTPTSSAQLVVRGVDSPQAQDPGGLTRAQVNQDRDQASPDNLTFDAGEEVREQTVGLIYENQLAQHHHLRLRGFSVFRDFGNRLPFPGDSQVQFDRKFGGGGALYTFDHPIAGFENRLMVGFDGGLQKDDRQRFIGQPGGLRGPLEVDQIETVSNMAGFVRNEFSVTDRLTVTGGLRYDSITFDLEDEFLGDGDQSGEQTLEELSPAVGATYRVNRAFIPFASFSTSFETPTTTEFQRCDRGGFLNLDAQTAQNYEFGARGSTDRLRYSISLFRIHTDDEIVSRDCPGGVDRTFSVNAGETVRDGVEAQVQADLLRGLSTSLSYTFSDFTFDEFRVFDNNANTTRVFDGNRLPGVPKHQANWGVTYRHPLGLFTAFEGTYVGDFYANNANSAESRDYFLGNWRGGYTHLIGQWELEGFVGINNLFDEEYNSNVRVNSGPEFFEPAPDRNYFGGIRVKRNFGFL